MQPEIISSLVTRAMTALKKERKGKYILVLYDPNEKNLTIRDGASWIHAEQKDMAWSDVELTALFEELKKQPGTKTISVKKVRHLTSAEIAAKQARYLRKIGHEALAKEVLENEAKYGG
jgi:hypothetical protein